MAKKPVDFPIEQEYERNVEGIPTMQETADGGLEVEMDADNTTMEEQEDGSVIVTVNDEVEGPLEDEDFYQNLADTGDVWNIGSIAMKYLDMIEKDKDARSERDKQYEEGIRRTGLGNDAPGGATFQGASKVVHPVMAEACVDFAANAIRELFTVDGPVRTNIQGEATDDKMQRAERKADFMNWQLVYQIPEFKDEEEQLLTQLPLGGSQFLKLWYDEQRHRPRSEFVPIDNVLLPFASTNFYESQRVTEIHDITQEEFEARVDSGLYRDVSYVRATEEPSLSQSQKATDKVEGKHGKTTLMESVVFITSTHTLS
jgi:hypothetical protein